VHGVKTAADVTLSAVLAVFDPFEIVRLDAPRGAASVDQPRSDEWRPRHTEASATGLGTAGE
jgi:hypothetical protein